MTSIIVKLLAVITMIIDHVGFLYFNDNLTMRMIGRASFPLFMYLFCEGLLYTQKPLNRNVKILVMAVITEPIFDLTFFSSVFAPKYQNVLFLFALSGMVVYLFDKYSLNRFDQALAIALSMVAADVLKIDYGAAGVLSIFICYYILKKKDKIKYYKFLSLVSFTPLMLQYLPSMISGQLSPIIAIGYILSIVIIVFYNGKKGSVGRVLTTLIYYSYPLHLLLLLFASYIPMPL